MIQNLAVFSGRYFVSVEIAEETRGVEDDECG